MFTEIRKKTLLGLVELIILMIYWLMPECSAAVELTSELSLDASPASADFFSFLAFFFSFFFLDFFSFFFLLFPEPSWKDVSFIMSFMFFYLYLFVTNLTAAEESMTQSYLYQDTFEKVTSPQRQRRQSVT